MEEACTYFSDQYEREAMGERGVGLVRQAWKHSPGPGRQAGLLSPFQALGVISEQTKARLLSGGAHTQC